MIHAEETPGAAAKVLSQIIERGSLVQGPAITAYVDRLRQHSPDALPADVVKKLEKHYLAAVMASGAAVGSAAAFPGIGTLAALSAVAGETAVFLEATAVYVLALAEVYGIPADHRERRRALVLAVLVGDESRRAVADLLENRQASREERLGGIEIAGGERGAPQAVGGDAHPPAVAGGDGRGPRLRREQRRKRAEPDRPAARLRGRRKSTGTPD